MKCAVTDCDTPPDVEYGRTVLNSTSVDAVSYIALCEEHDLKIVWPENMDSERG